MPFPTSCTLLRKFFATQNREARIVSNRKAVHIIRMRQKVVEAAKDARRERRRIALENQLKRQFARTARQFRRRGYRGGEVLYGVKRQVTETEDCTIEVPAQTKCVKRIFGRDKVLQISPPTTRVESREIERIDIEDMAALRLLMFDGWIYFVSATGEPIRGLYYYDADGWLRWRSFTFSVITVDEFVHYIASEYTDEHSNVNVRARIAIQAFAKLGWLS